jgi:hypothetical protein
MRCKKRKISKSKLIIGEGKEDEKKFLCHMKDIYYKRNEHYTIRLLPAQGGGPKSVIAFTEKQIQNINYDEIVILLDEIPNIEKELNNKEKNFIKDKKIKLLVSSPICLEGMLLQIKGIALPKSKKAKACKKRLNERLSGYPFTTSFLNNHFSRHTLNEAAKSMPTIKNLINFFSKK